MDLQDVAKVVGQARQLRDAGDRAGAVGALRACLEQVRATGDNFLACYVLHDLGHAEESAADQLRWHREALAAAEAVDDDRVERFYPSLHLNIAKTYLGCGQSDLARTHIDAADSVVHVLPRDDYGTSIRDGIAKVRRALELPD